MAAIFLTAKGSSTLKHMKYEVFGNVQGVNFRYCTQKRALQLGLVGWVRNTAMGTVEGVVEGPESSIQEMRHWLSQIGSPHSRVENFTEQTTLIETSVTKTKKLLTAVPDVLTQTTFISKQEQVTRRPRGSDNPTPLKTIRMECQTQTTQDERKSCHMGSFKLTLNKPEETLFALLLTFIQATGIHTILRANGGWVRDKLLKRTSHDIDLTIDNMTGVEFASKFNNWLKESGRKTYTIGIIQRNPQQSKHLETATMTIGGISLDLVNLRTETYTMDSRIPDKVEIGTPLEDARRRDFTINSLFYNINENCLEDFTGRGIKDLENGVISTPIDALITFKDDPLRLLRAARFSTVLGFKLDENIITAGRNPDIHAALSKMVSRERMGQEFEKMLLKGSAKRGLEILCNEFKVGNILFKFPVEDKFSHANWMSYGIQSITELSKIIKIQDCNGSEPQADQFPTLLFPLSVSISTYKLIVLAAFLSDLRHVTCFTSGGKKTEGLPYYVLVESLKFPKRDGERHSRVGYNGEVLTKTLNIQDEFKKSLRVLFGSTIRACGLMWNQSLVLAVVLLIMSNTSKIDIAKKEAQEVYNCILEYNLTGVLALTPPLNGSELINLLPKLPKGPTVKEILDYEVDVWFQKSFPPLRAENVVFISSRFKGVHYLNVAEEYSDEVAAKVLDAFHGHRCSVVYEYLPLGRNT